MNLATRGIAVSMRDSLAWLVLRATSDSSFSFAGMLIWYYFPRMLKTTSTQQNRCEIWYEAIKCILQNICWKPICRLFVVLDVNFRKMLALIAWTGENYPSRGLYILQKAYYIAITLTPCSGVVMNKLMDWDPPKSNVVRILKRNLYHAIVFLHLIISRSKFMLSFMKSFASYIYNRPRFM